MSDKELNRKVNRLYLLAEISGENGSVEEAEELRDQAEALRRSDGNVVFTI